MGIPVVIQEMIRDGRAELGIHIIRVVPDGTVICAACASAEVMLSDCRMAGPRRQRDRAQERHEKDHNPFELVFLH